MSQTDAKKLATFTPPIDLHAVALLYIRPGGTPNCIVGAEVVPVDPNFDGCLTRDEIIARADAKSRATWDEAVHGKSDEWRLHGGTFTTIYVIQPDR